MAPALALALLLAPLPALAAPAEAPGPDSSAASETAPGDAGESAPGDAAPGEAAPAEAEGPIEVEVEREAAPIGGGVGGAIVDPNDPNAGRAQSDLEGESLDQDVEGVPERLPKMQAAGWWTTFTAVAIATTGGVFAGIAEVRQDKAERLAYAFDLDTGRAQLYGDVADEYEQLLSQGNTYRGLAQGFLVAGGVTLVAGIVLFSLDTSRRRRGEQADKQARIRVEPGAGGLSLRF